MLPCSHAVVAPLGRARTRQVRASCARLRPPRLAGTGRAGRRCQGFRQELHARNRGLTPAGRLPTSACPPSGGQHDPVLYKNLPPEWGAWIHVRSCLAADRAPVGFWGASRWHPAPANLAGCAAPSEVGPAAAEEQGRHRGRAPWDGCAGAQPRTQSPTTTHIQPHSTRRNTTPCDSTLNIIYPNTN